MSDYESISIKPKFAYCRTIDNYEDWIDSSIKLPKVELGIAREQGKRQLFRKYAEKWKEETRRFSLTIDKAMNKNYQYIIGLGEPVISMILEDLDQNGGHWFWALEHLSRVNPITNEDRGDIRKMREAWLAWGRANGYIGR